MGGIGEEEMEQHGCFSFFVALLSSHDLDVKKGFLVKCACASFLFRLVEKIWPT